VGSVVLLQAGVPLGTFLVQRGGVIDAPSDFDEIQINFSSAVQKNLVKEASFRVSNNVNGNQIKTKVTPESLIASSKLEETLGAGAVYKVVLEGTGRNAIKMSDGKKLIGGDFGFTIRTP
jgi:hypothetical protein